MAVSKLRPNQELFLDRYAKTRNISKAAKLPNIARSTVYTEWMPQPAFKAAFDEVEDGFVDDAEECLRKSANRDWKAALATIEKYKRTDTKTTAKRPIRYADDD